MSCTWHLQQNVGKAFPGVKAELFWRVARAINQRELAAAKVALKAASPKAAQYLAAIPENEFVRCMYERPLYGHSASSAAESKHSAEKDARVMPVSAMFAEMLEMAASDLNKIQVSLRAAKTKGLLLVPSSRQTFEDVCRVR